MIDESKAILEVATAFYHSGKESGNQYYCRSAVSRAYYRVLLFARSIAGMESDQTHWGVIQHLENETRRLNRSLLSRPARRDTPIHADSRRCGAAVNAG